jgi:hypothetical protein
VIGFGLAILFVACIIGIGLLAASIG